METFKCPNCGGNKLDNGRCAYCDTQIFKHEVPVEDTTNLEKYFVQYQPNRPKAIKALCADTGMSVVQAKKLIDELFDAKLRESHSSDIKVMERNLRNAWKEFLNG